MTKIFRFPDTVKSVDEVGRMDARKSVADVIDFPQTEYVTPALSDNAKKILYEVNTKLIKTAQPE